MQDSNGLWFVPANTAQAPRDGQVGTQSTGGPDEFGYTWNDSVAYSWKNASAGTNTGINNTVDHSGAIGLGFSFKYYQNVYSQLYISRYGFASFSPIDYNDSQSRIPNSGLPNNVIAPHWVPVSSVNGYVRYLKGGTAPNRWFAVEWNKITSNCCNGDPAEVYTFEAILYETSGDIVFQYNTMTISSGDYMCQSSGIEDSAGLDGLSITDFCEQIAPTHAVHIYRPAPSARVGLDSLYQGNFTSPGGTASFQIPVRNTGEVGTDTYDLTPSSAWAMSLYAANGATPLTDTDTDGVLDTGSVAQGATVIIIAKVQAPPGAVVGDSNLR